MMQSGFPLKLRTLASIDIFSNNLRSRYNRIRAVLHLQEVSQLLTLRGIGNSRAGWILETQLRFIQIPIYCAATVLLVARRKLKSGICSYFSYPEKCFSFLLYYSYKTSYREGKTLLLKIARLRISK